MTSRSSETITLALSHGDGCFEIACTSHGFEAGILLNSSPPHLVILGLVTVATPMGHRSLDTTAIYTKPSKEDMAKPVERLSITKAV